MSQARRRRAFPALRRTLEIEQARGLAGHFRPLKVDKAGGLGRFGHKRRQ
jgi:hypothetical protein